MSKKLLEESTIRSFMKLANLQPLSEKFITEKYMEETSHDKKVAKDPKKDEKKDDKKKKLEEEDLEEGEQLDEEELEEGETLEEEALEEDSLEEGEQLDEEVVEEGDELEEGKESEGRPTAPKQKVKGVAKPGKVKGAHADHKFTPLKAGNHHSDKPDSIEAKTKSNAPKKNNSQFEVVSENLEEMGGMKKPAMPSMEEEMDAPEGGDTGGGAESGPHKDKMKGLIRSMLENLKQMGEEYGMTMEISDAGAEDSAPPEGGEEMTPPAGEEEDESMMQEKLDEMVEKLTKRVAARLVKESKKRR